MAYQVLARKYRPQRFSDVAGQDHVTRTMLNALAQGRIAHGYIFSGHRGIGKTTIARILAMALNCRTAIGAETRLTPEPCGVCESCTEVRAGNAVDVIEIDAATNRGIDEIRELRDAARYRPARDRYKIYILDEAHQITDAAFNALLKTLEEPPDHVVFMMATTQPEDIPQTIRSRCQHFSFHAVKFDDILIQLRTIAVEEKVIADDDALALLAEAGDGSMRDALSIMDQAIASAPLVDGQAQLDAGQIRELMGTVPNTAFERLLEWIGENQSAPVIEEVNRLLNAGNSASQLARQFVRYLRNVLMARIAGERTELLQLSPDERARAGRSALLFSEEDLTRFLGVMLRTFDELNYRQEPRFHLELGLLKLVHLQRLLPVEQLLSQLGGAAAPRLGGGPLPGGTAQRGAQTSRGAGPASQNASAPGGLAAAGGRMGSSAPAGPPLEPHAVGPHPVGLHVSASTITPPQGEETVSPFSPFEADSRRKGSDPAGAGRPQAPAGSTSMEGNGNGTNAARAGMPAEKIVAGGLVPARTPDAAPAIDSDAQPFKTNEISGNFKEVASANLPGKTPSSMQTAELGEDHEASASLPDAPEARDSATARVPVLDEQVASHGKDVDSGGLDSIREHVCGALEQSGHNTAAALLNNGSWREEGDGIQVEVAAKKIMLGLTMNPAAEKICREAMRSLAGDGKPRALSFVSGDGSSAAGGGRSVPAGSRSLPRQPSGSVQLRAMENPLVRQAQELFDAEVRSVVDLRNK